MVKDIEICAVKIPKYENLNLSHLHFLMQYISVEKRDRILRFYHAEDAMRTLYADILLRTMLCSYEQLKNRDLDFIYNTYGKPYLAINSNIEFNVSHSGDWVVSVVYRSQIGVDIEEMKEINYLELSKRYFSSRELDDIMIKPIDKQLQHFYKLWTLKESYIKNIGCGLSIPLDSFSITQKNGNYFLVDIQGDMIEGYKFMQYSIDAHYKCSVCVKDSLQLKPSEVQIYDSQELINEFTKYT